MQLSHASEVKIAVLSIISVVENKSYVYAWMTEWKHALKSSATLQPNRVFF